MKRHAAICAVIAAALLPGALPIAIGVFSARAIHRWLLRRRVRREVIAVAGACGVPNGEVKREALSLRSLRARGV